MNLVSTKTALRCGVAVVALAWGSAAWAQTKTFDVPSEDAVKAIPEFARQAGIQIVAPADQLKGVKTPALSGAIDLHLALSRLLDGTGIEIASDDGQTIVLRVHSKNVRAASNEAADIGPTETVIVTGSRLPRTAKEAAQEVKVYSAQQIERSGQTTVSGFLSTLPEVSNSSSAEPAQAGFGAASQTTVQLRGLPVGTTLVLLDGRRVDNGPFGSFFDLNNIPVAVIDRVEIQPQGSSAIYGSDALAGVVNIILKKNFEGLQADAHYGFASGTDEASTSVAWGQEWSRGSFSVVGSYFTRSELDRSERTITGNADYSAFGGPNLLSTFACNPGTVFSADGTNLNGLSSPQAAIPSGLHGTITPSDFAATAGKQNLCTLDAPLLPESHRASVLASFNYEIFPSITFFAQALYSRISQVSNTLNKILLPGLPLPAFNPNNPFGETVIVSEEIPVRSRSTVNQNFFLPVVGVRGSLLDKFDWEIAGWSSVESDRSTFIGPNFGGLFGALFSADPATALNPFVTGPQSKSVESAIFSDNASRLSGGNLTANGFIRGPILTLASGDVQAVIGAEYNRSRLTNKAQNTPSTLDHRDEHSFFGELRIPILANHLHPEAGDTLAVGIAVRYDDYTDFGSHVTPQYSVEWRPFDTLLIRGAYSKSFRAPNLYNLFAFAIPITHPNYPVIDPLNGNALVLTNVILEDRPLKPESGQSRSVGFVWSPQFLENLQMSLTYWGMDQFNRVSEPTVQQIVDNANLFPGCVKRGPSVGGAAGPIESVCGGFFNFGALSVSGFDVDLTYQYQTDFGTLTPTISASEIYKYKAALVPGAPITDRVSKANTDGFAPRWKGTASLGWSLEPYSAAIDGRYVGKYQDYAPLVNGPNAGSFQSLGNYWVFDANFKVDIGEVVANDNPYLKGAYVSIGGVNLFDTLPRFSMYSNGLSGYDPAEYDIRGRFLYANLGFRY